MKQPITRIWKPAGLCLIIIALLILLAYFLSIGFVFGGVIFIGIWLFLYVVVAAERLDSTPPPIAFLITRTAGIILFIFLVFSFLIKAGTLASLAMGVMAALWISMRMQHVDDARRKRELS